MGHTERFEYVGFGKRAAAALLDGLIAFVIIPIQLVAVPWGAEHRTVLPDLLLAAVLTSFYVAMVIRFGGTPGKLLLGIRIVDARGEFLGIARALRREIYPNIFFNVLSFIQTALAFARYPESTPHATFYEVAILVRDYGQPLSPIIEVLYYSVFLDIGVVLFNKKKRAIHDFIAGSYVITKDSYRAAREPEANEHDAGDVPEPVEIDRTQETE